jgi:APA family basic amino acid/polyamine antiporter
MISERASRMPGPARESSLLRAVGVWGLAASIINVTVGGGIFRLPAAVAASLGAGAPLAYLACAVAMGLIALCFAEAGSRVARTGGPYAYVEVAFGPFAGFLAGVLVWLLGTLAVAAVSTIFVDSIGALAPRLDGAAPRAVLLIVIFVLLAGVNIRGVRQGVILNAVATVAKLLPLVFLIVAGMFAIRPANLAWTEGTPFGAVARTSILLIFAFSGIESALVPSGEIKDVRRTVPRAIFFAISAITLLYLALQLVAQGVLGPDLGSQRAPLAEAAARVFGPWGRTFLLVSATVSMFGYVSGMTLAVPRALFAFARDGFLPRRVAAVHSRFHTPHVAIVLQSALVCALAITNGFERLAILANLVTLILYGACCLAAWELRRRDVQADGPPLRVPGSGPVPLAACLAIAWILTSVTREEWSWAGGVIAVASLLFLATGRRRARAGAAASHS